MNFIYFPSLSSGNSYSWLKDNYRLPNGMPTQFWNQECKDQHPEIYHPYFLLSAGHRMKNMDTRKEMNLENAIVIGDSGGYQIATGAIQFDKNKREEIFNWLEANSDIAMNLDIPPRLSYEGKFNESLEISFDNFKFFEQNQSGKTKFLNVLQGNTEKEYNVWYEKVKDLQFSGWAIGGLTGKYHKLMFTLALLLKNNEFKKPNNRWIHVLGLSSIQDFILLSFLQTKLNEYSGNKIRISTDSSTPNRVTIYGGYIFEMNWRTMNFTTISLLKGDVPQYNMDAELPCPISCKHCKGHTFKEIAEWSTPKTYAIMTAHNMNMFTNAIRMINKLPHLHENLLKEILTKDFYLLYRSIHEMLNSPDPILVYRKYEQLYKQLSQTEKNIVEKTTINQFFNLE